MNKAGTNGCRGLGTTATALALLFVVCLAESATEQRINNRGSKTILVDKVNGWRAQRGGSCLSYGHSCWGAHGKRSSRPPVTAPDWYLSRILRRMASDAELNRARAFPERENDINAIYQVNVPDAAVAEKLTSENQDNALEVGSRMMEAKPMLDDEMLSNMKLWQIMKEASENK